MRKLLLLLSIAGLLSSCGKYLRTGVMLKTPKDYAYDRLADSLTKEDYKLSPNNEVQITVYSNDGFKLIDLTNSTSNGRGNIEVIVDNNGNLKLPLLGLIKVSGMTVNETIAMLEEKYTEFYVNPFVQLKITNKRVIVFPGLGGSAKVIPLVNNNTTVFEALAQAGGITEDGKAYRVKLIRNSGPKPQVYQMDLSRIEGLVAGNTVVLANDIIYVEPRIRYARRIVTELAPYMSLLSSAILIYSIITR
jgi:polysaccharide export outer membrane protein